MTSLAIQVPENGPSTALDIIHEPAERVQDYASRSKSAATISAYASGWRDFLSFCADRGAKAATIARRLVVISQAHKGADLPSPTTSSLVHRVHAGIRRTIGTAQPGKAPALVADLSARFRKFQALQIWQGPVGGPMRERGVHDVDQFGKGALEGQRIPLLAVVQG